MTTITDYGSTADQPWFVSDLETIEHECTTFIGDIVAATDATGVIVALSGGLTSTTAATLAVEALGPDRVYGLVLPTGPTADTALRDAQAIAFDLGIAFRVIDIQSILDHVIEALAVLPGNRRRASSAETQLTELLSTPLDERTGYADAVATIGTHLRMMALSFEATTTSRLVLGTGTWTEYRLGLLTTYGTNGADLLPLGDLYNTEVYQLARHLNVSDHIIEEAPTAGLWEDHPDYTELGATYETIDAILQTVIDEEWSIEEIATAFDIERDLVTTVANMYVTTAHTRSHPPTPATYAPREGE